MTDRPTPPHEGAEDTDDSESPLGWFLGAGVGLLAAILCFTPVWDEVAGRGSGRRAGFSAILHLIGPVGVAVVALLVAAAFVALGVRAMRTGR